MKGKPPAPTTWNRWKYYEIIDLATHSGSRMWCPKKTHVVPETGDSPERKSEHLTHQEHVVPEKKTCGARIWCPKKYTETTENVSSETTENMWCPKKISQNVVPEKISGTVLGTVETRRFGHRFGAAVGHRSGSRSESPSLVLNCISDDSE